MSIKAHLLHNTSKYKHTIRKIISKNLLNILQTNSQNHTSTSQLPETLLPFKPVSQNLGTSNAKTQNTKVIGHKTSFPKHPAPSIYPQNRKSYAHFTTTAVQKNGVITPFKSQSFHTPSTTTITSSTTSTTTTTTSTTTITQQQHHHNINNTRPP